MLLALAITTLFQLSFMPNTDTFVIGFLVVTLFVSTLMSYLLLRRV